MAEVVDSLSIPANPSWLMARTLATLNPYFEKETPQAVREIEASDWAEELGEYPQWAIERASRWWKSAGNDDRRKRPLEGDISARCKVEMAAVNGAKYRLERGMKFGGFTADATGPRPEPNREMASRLMAEAGFAPRTFGGEAAE